MACSEVGTMNGYGGGYGVRGSYRPPYRIVSPYPRGNRTVSYPYRIHRNHGAKAPYLQQRSGCNGVGCGRVLRYGGGKSSRAGEIGRHGRRQPHIAIPRNPHPLIRNGTLTPYSPRPGQCQPSRRTIPVQPLIYAFIINPPRLEQTCWLVCAASVSAGLV